MKKKKVNFFLKYFIYLGILVAIFVVTISATKYYFYDSDFSVKKTDLSKINVDGIKIGMNINEIDLTKYTNTDIVIEDCNYNFEEISFKTNSKGKIKYIVANFNDVDFNFTGNEEQERAKKVNDIWEVLGSNYKTELYKSTENNYRKISRYVDNENDIYLGLVYSRFNNEMLSVIISDDRIKD